MNKRKHEYWKWYEVMMFSALMGIALFCILSLGVYFKCMQISRNEFEKLSQVIHTSPAQNQGTKSQEFETIQVQNGDCVGWLEIDDTGLDYPIMQKPGQAEYYLRRNFEGEYSMAGTPFMDSL